MAGVADSWKTTNIAYKEGRLYRGAAVPGAGARPTLFSDGTLDATANPSALHMGATTGGSKLMVKSEQTKVYVDEFRAPIITNIDSVNMGISAELVGVTDMQLDAYLLPGVGTRATASGYDYVTVGIKAIAYDCVIEVFQLIEDTSKYGWFMLYNALNESGIEWAQSRKALGSMPVSFVGYEVTSRATTDTIGQFGKQIA
jgi:hypothetical protein